MRLILKTFALAAVAAAPAAPLLADDASEVRELRAEILLLEKRLESLEHSRATAAAAAPAPSPAAAKVTADEKGLRAVTADKSASFHLGGLVQLDSRTFFNDGGGVLNNSFVLRRARLVFDGTLGNDYSFLIMPDWGGSTPVIQDAYVNWALSDAVQLRFGRFKAPIGLELLQSDSYTFFDERSIATDLVPNRDLGIQLWGTLGGGLVQYQAAVLNGVGDAASTTNADFDNDKDLAARVIVNPFASDPKSSLANLGFGIAASTGREKGASGVTSGYKTDGQQTFFKYNATVVADGLSWRVSPQAYWYSGPFGALAEYVVSTVNARPTAAGAKTELQNKAWDIQAGWALTGENATYTGVAPAHPFNWRTGAWGAFQVVARYSDLKIDNKAFPLFAAPGTNAREDSGWGVGANWYLNRAVRISLDGYDDQFTNLVAVSATQILRQDEKSLIGRFQLSF